MEFPLGQHLDLESLRDRRLAARKLLDQGVTQAEVARKLQVSRQSVSRWAAEPAAKLGLIRPLGRKSRLNARQIGQLRLKLLALANGQGVSTRAWTLPQVRDLIVEFGGPRFSLVHVWRLLGRMGFGSGRTLARDRDGDSAPRPIGQMPVWPELKNKPAARTRPARSWTRAA